jgi:hypothetical protein
LFVTVDATGRTFSGSEVFTFEATRGGGNTGSLAVYAGDIQILSKDIAADLGTSPKSFSAPLPPSVGGTVFYIYIVVNASKNGVVIDNTGISGGALPITLSSFKVNLSADSPILTWTTLSEIDNYGFFVQKSQDMQTWADVTNSFQAGYGTTIEQHSYSFADNTLPTGNYYRLHQVDLDGTSHYSDAVSVVAGVDVTPVVKEFVLNQSYPNPFNPSTTISYSVPKQAHASLVIYNMLGEQVATLVNEVVAPGAHSVVWNASGLSSGTYFYVLNSDSRVQVRKTMLVK